MLDLHLGTHYLMRFAMEIPFNIVSYLEQQIKRIALKCKEFDNSFFANIRLADPRFGDYQANGVLPFAKKLNANPRQLARKLLDKLRVDGEFDSSFVTIEIAGPGFINFKFSPKFMLEWLKQYKDEASYAKAASNFYKGKKISIDYSSPNTAKQMHVGHMRSMIVGEALQKLFNFCGAEIVRDNHIGDWGTQFGILIMSIKEAKYDLDEDHDDILAELEVLYKKGNALFESDNQYKEIARSELVKLQSGDPENFGLWEKIVKVSYDAFQEIYDLMDIQFDVILGESFYRDKLDRVYKELTELGIAQESQGALVVFHKNPKGGADYPLMIRKQDGASNYATTDLATVLYHTEETGVDEMVYVTDGRQQDHFKHLFLTAQNWFNKKGYKTPYFHHAWFGTILGEDGKAIKTRSGDPIKLKELLNEAMQRAYKIVSEKNPDLDEDYKKQVAKTVGLDSIRYADLSQNRTSDYVFSWDRILSFDGNTAPYLLYAVARIYSILAKAQLKPGEFEEKAVPFETDTECALARKLLSFPLVISQTIIDLRPHILCTYLFELSGIFSSFYNADKVIANDESIRSRRLLLCTRTLRVLETGLHLLGLKTLERM